MGPDSRVLITKARKIAQKYMLTYGEPIPANQLVREIASVMQVSLSLRAGHGVVLCAPSSARFARSAGIAASGKWVAGDLLLSGARRAETAGTGAHRDVLPSWKAAAGGATGTDKRARQSSFPSCVARLACAVPVERGSPACAAPSVPGRQERRSRPEVFCIGGCLLPCVIGWALGCCKDSRVQRLDAAP